MENTNVQKPFTEHDFVATLLPLLCQNGVWLIQEQELSKKLFYYYKNSDYSELFQNIGLSQYAVDMEVDINQGLQQEKYFSRKIIWNSIDSSRLHLTYEPDTDLSQYEQHLSEDGKIKIRKMAEEIAIRRKIESKSRHKLCIYGVDPNQGYTLVHGKSAKHILSFKLITDGDISYMKYNETNGEGNYHYECPMFLNEYRALEDNKTAYVHLENASFAIKQGLCNDKVCYSIVYTEIMEPTKLEQIARIANKKHKLNGRILTEKPPYVKKLLLK